MKVRLDKDTQSVLREYQRTVRECQARMQLIVQTVLNVKGKKGDYQLSPDGTELIQMEVKDEET